MNLPESLINIINIGMIVIIAFALIFGIVKGFLWQVIKVLGLLASMLVSWILSPSLSKLVKIVPENWISLENSAIKEALYNRVNSIVWFIIVFVICLLIILLLKPVFKSITELPIIKPIDKTLGGLLALVPVFIFFMLVTFLLNSAIFKNGKEIIDASGLRFVNTISTQTKNVISKSFNQNTAISKLLNDPKSLSTDDLESVVNWLKNSKVEINDILQFMKKYGFENTKIIETIQNLIQNNNLDLSELQKIASFLKNSNYSLNDIKKLLSDAGISIDVINTIIENIKQ